MNLLEKAEATLNQLSGSGKLNERQAEMFVDLLTAPFPPVWLEGSGLIRYLVYLYRSIRFKVVNRRWERRTGRKNPFRGGFVFRRMTLEQYNEMKRLYGFKK